jgi:citrate synthase
MSTVGTVVVRRFYAHACIVFAVAAPKSSRSGVTTPARWSSALTSIEPNEILLRGYRLDELMGRVPFGDAIYLLMLGELPSPAISRIIDAILVSFIDHGATPPSTLAARNAATTGASIRGAVAAGVLAFGRHYGGDVLACRGRLDEGLKLAREEPLASAAAEMAARLVQAHEIPPPGFGHRYHTIDPRATRLLQMAHELEIDHRYTQFIRALEHALSRHPDLQDHPLPVNVDGAVAAISGDLGLPPEVADALLLISRVPGLAAHVLEEQQRERPMRAIDPVEHGYDGPGGRTLDVRRK